VSSACFCSDEFGAVPKIRGNVLHWCGPELGTYIFDTTSR
jgi:hypothetical protein